MQLKFIKSTGKLTGISDNSSGCFSYINSNWWGGKKQSLQEFIKWHIYCWYKLSGLLTFISSKKVYEVLVY